MGTFAVWELAALLQRASRQPVRVIAPPPGVTRWVNNKIAFADTVTRLFGPQMRPRMVAVANFATLSQRVASWRRTRASLSSSFPTLLEEEATW